MLSVIIPIWNQGEQLYGNFPKLINVLSKSDVPYEIILIDDGSEGNTLQLLQNIRDNYKDIIIETTAHFGQYRALLTGFKIAKGDVIVTLDADMKASPIYIPQLIDKIKEGHDVAIAWRNYRPGLGLVRKTGSFLINQYTNLVTGRRLHDHACSLKAFSAKLVKANLNRPDLINFFPIMLDRYALKICELPVNCKPKSSRESVLNILGLLKQAMYFIVDTSINIQHK